MLSAGIVAIGVAAEAHLARGFLAKRYRQAVEGRRQLELQFAEFVVSHERLTDELKRGQERALELAEALASARARLDETAGLLAEETRKVRELQIHLATRDRQAEQLQGELVIALQQQEAAGDLKAPGPVQLDRIVVSSAEESALEGRVVSVHPEWNFIVMDIGWSAVRIGDTVSVFRHEQLLAKARVERVQEGVCAATILPGWKAAEVHINDLVRLL